MKFGIGHEREYIKAGVNLKKRHIREAYLKIDIDKLNEEYIKEVRAYFQSIGWDDIDVGTHLLYEQKLGVKSKYFVPGDGYKKAIAFFNEEEMMSAYTDKNMYGLIVRSDRQPKNLVRRVRGNYFDNSGNGIERRDLKTKLNENVEYIIKPSRKADGEKIGLFSVKGNDFILSRESTSLEQLEKNYGTDFLIQEKIEQHPSISQMHPESINTLRMLTFRWKGEIQHLMTFLRVGCNGRINDNAGTGGVCIGVNENGELYNYAVNIKGEVFDEHPSNGFSFKNERVKIENFENFKQYVVRLHKDIPHHDLVSWDIVVDKTGEPLFIEHNFRGVLWLYQFACGKPLFGELSSEVLPYISRHFHSRVPAPKIEPIFERSKMAVKIMIGRSI